MRDSHQIEQTVWKIIKWLAAHEVHPLGDKGPHEVKMYELEASISDFNPNAMSEGLMGPGDCTCSSPCSLVRSGEGEVGTYRHYGDHIGGKSCCYVAQWTRVVDSTDAC
ncbi:hypothetical protein SCLCIDRAFT_1223787 [Scleroderma citrinum Foug A]|uniref:Uncharacterized protein n=1 Tax=Scleroderma citrinum Foug A TaxID=1036808 RepID=A0A0C3D8G6_9AGAM|nr:hypothetical protein SCLCIDRAFT_1223787 [Scleroderma citrinum Foug A]